MTATPTTPSVATPRVRAVVSQPIGNVEAEVQTRATVTREWRPSDGEKASEEWRPSDGEKASEEDRRAEAWVPEQEHPARQGHC